MPASSRPAYRSCRDAPAGKRRSVRGCVDRTGSGCARGVHQRGAPGADRDGGGIPVSMQMYFVVTRDELTDATSRELQRYLHSCGGLILMVTRNGPVVALDD